MNEISIYPPFKEAARLIAKNDEPDAFYSDNALAEMLEHQVETKDYHFSLMALSDHLLDEHSICLLRVCDPRLGKGYKVANDSEKSTISVERQQRKIRNATLRQGKILATINPAKLADDVERNIFERQLTRNGFTRAFLGKTRLLSCVPGKIIIIDRPRLIRRLVG